MKECLIILFAVCLAFDFLLFSIGGQSVAIDSVTAVMQWIAQF